MHTFRGMMMMCTILVRVSDVLHQVKYTNDMKTNSREKISQRETPTTAAAEIHSPPVFDSSEPLSLKLPSYILCVLELFLCLVSPQASRCAGLRRPDLRTGGR